MTKYWVQSRMSDKDVWHDEAYSENFEKAMGEVRRMKEAFPQLLCRIHIKEKIEILDIIVHRYQWGHQYMTVINRRPIYVYERIGNKLIADDCGFMNCYRFDKPSSRFYAFGGRKFKIPLTDGTYEQAYGQWWSSFDMRMSRNISTGIATEEELARCNVFTSGSIPEFMFNEWLSFNNFSNNSRKYDKRRQGLYGQHTIISRW